jgi:hypothetical protein
MPRSRSRSIQSTRRAAASCAAHGTGQFDGPGVQQESSRSACSCRRRVRNDGERPHHRPGPGNVAAGGEVKVAPQPMASLPELEGAVVRLREVRVEDLDGIEGLLADGRVTRHQLRRPPRTRTAVAEWIQLMLRRRAQGTVLCFVVTTRTAPTVVGIAQLSVPRAANGVEWIGVGGSAPWTSCPVQMNTLVRGPFTTSPDLDPAPEPAIILALRVHVGWTKPANRAHANEDR